jgi:hypothetical protein
MPRGWGVSFRETDHFEIERVGKVPALSPATERYFGQYASRRYLFPGFGRLPRDEVEAFCCCLSLQSLKVCAAAREIAAFHLDFA